MTATRPSLARSVLLLGLLLGAKTAAQSSFCSDPTYPTPCVFCAVKISGTGPYTSTVACEGDVQPVVAAQYASIVNNTLTFTYNGQALPGDNLTALWSSGNQMPGLVAMGLPRDLNDGTQNGTLVVQATVNDVTLPELPASDTSNAVPLSALRFTQLENLVVVNSSFQRINSSAASSNDGPHAALVFLDDTLTGAVDANGNLLSLGQNVTLTVSNCTFVNVTGSVPFYPNGGGALTLGAITSFNGITGTSNNYLDVVIVNSTFTDNTAQGSGAAVAIVACEYDPCPTQVIFNNSKFYGNSNSLGSGGAVQLQGTSATFDGCTFANNTAGLGGGAVQFDASQISVTLNISGGTTFLSNSAGLSAAPGDVENECGGALRVLTSVRNTGAQTQTWLGAASMTVRDSSFVRNYNVLTNKGGAVCFGRDKHSLVSIPGVVTGDTGLFPSDGLFHNTIFDGNYLENAQSQGGAVYDYISNGLTFDNCTFVYNTAGSGAAVYSLWSDSLTLTGGTLVNYSNSVYSGGGAVAVSDLQFSLTIQNASFSNNTCSQLDSVLPTGAAVWMERQLVNNPYLKQNYTASISDAVFLNNTCQTAGALYIDGVQHTVGPNVNFTGNQAFLKQSGTGGAVQLIAKSLVDLAQVNNTALRSTFMETTFDGNSAQQLGGALLVTSIWAPTLTNCTFRNNYLSTTRIVSEGGAVYFDKLQSPAVTLDTVVFQNNTAYSGGALAVADNAVNMTNCWFDGNQATSTAGAFLWARSTSDITQDFYQVNITTTNFTSNVASNTAGALMISQAGAVISGSFFFNNSAVVNGGALDLENCAPYNGTSGLYAPWPGVIDIQSVYLINTTFQANSANQSLGGGVRASASRLIVSDSTFEANNCSGGGGGLYGTTRSTINFYGGTLTANSGGGQGGAIYTQSCDVTLNGTQLLNNTAARGGAVSSSLALADSNKPGLVVIELNNVVASDNVAAGGLVALAGNGGVLSAEAVNATVRGGLWTGNNAASAGGALDARGLGTLLLQDAEMSGNTASDTGGAVNAESMLLVTLDSALLDGNAAGADGGGLWADGSNCTVLSASKFTGCTASGSGGGAWVGLPTQGAGCSAAEVQAMQGSLSGAAQAALAALAAGGGASPSLLAQGLGVSAGSSGVAGGGLALQMASSGGGALLDQLAISGCSAQTGATCTTAGSAAGDGGGLYVTSATTAQLCTTSTGPVWAAVNVTSSSIYSNTASSGNGGGVAVNCPAQGSLNVQVTLTNTTFRNNTASNGGALSVEGGAAFLSLQQGTSVTSSIAQPPAASPASGAQGGCVYASQCLALLVGPGTKLSGCQAQGTSGAAASGVRSLGGGVMADSCAMLVVDGATVTGSSAAAGGGVAFQGIGAVLVLGATLTGNAAVQVNATVSGAADTLGGVGGGLWADGNSSSLLYGTQVAGNAASLFGGGVAVLTPGAGCNASILGMSTLPALSAASLALYASLLNQLSARTSTGCFTMSVQSCSITDNMADSGGAFFAAGNNSLLAKSCADIDAQLPVSGTPSALTPIPGNLSAIANCGSGSGSGSGRRGLLALPNIATSGYGAIVASLPVSLSLNATQQFYDPNNPNSTTFANVSLVRFLPDGSLIMPSSSPLTSVVIIMDVLDAAGQPVQDPKLTSQITIKATSDPNNENITVFGQRVASYDSSINSSTYGQFPFQGISLRAVVAQSYVLNFTLESTLVGGDAVAPLRLTAYVPDCGNGQQYSDSTNMSCLTCDGSFFGLSQGNLGMPSPYCLPCPSNAQCSGGAVVVPVSSMWHSAPNSTEMHQCLNSYACTRSDDQVAALQNCQEAWYQYQILQQLNALDQAESDVLAQSLLEQFGCTLYSTADLEGLTPFLYLNQLCADGYGGNLCGVCVANSDGYQTAVRSSNNLCGRCKPTYVVYLITAGLFVVNLLVILIQVAAALGEQMIANTLQFADIFSAVINHVQYLIVIIKLQFDWPPAVTSFHNVIASLVSFAQTSVEYASITCLSDGSPEGQATYQMAAGLVMPLILICAAVFFWVIGWWIRVCIWYPRMDAESERVKKEQEAVEDALQGAVVGPDGYTSARQVTLSMAEEPGGIEGVHPGARDVSTFSYGSPSFGPGSAPSGDNKNGGAPTGGWADSINRTLQNIPKADESEDQAPPQEAAPPLQHEQPSIRRNETALRRWQLPGAEKVPENTLWFDKEADKHERAQRREENKMALSLVEKLRVLDKYMPLPLQIFAVIINTSFVVYQGWASAALQVFSCNALDDGQLDPSIPFDYYANFQLATNPNGYWQLNMNQACYEGSHLHKWTPIGAVMSFVIGIGVPFIMFLPVYLNRQRLTKADVQLKWGWIYIRYFYGRVPYWMAVNTLELLLFIIVQSFANSLSSVIEQAALLQLTLIVIMIFNTCMWPLVHPLLILTSFLSNSVLIFTLCLAMIIGDGSAWTLSLSAANTCGAFIIISNVFFVVLLVVLFYKHLRDVIADGFLEYRDKTQEVVKVAWVKMSEGLARSRVLRSITRATSRASKSVRSGSRRLGSGSQKAADSEAKGEVALVEGVGMGAASPGPENNRGSGAATPTGNNGIAAGGAAPEVPGGQDLGPKAGM